MLIQPKHLPSSQGISPFFSVVLVVIPVHVPWSELLGAGLSDKTSLDWGRRCP